jgi:hypothetical protein
MNVKALHINNHLATSLCIGLLVLSTVAYMYFLSLSVVHVVMRKEASEQISQLRSDIAQLESVYIDARHSISARVARLDGNSQNQNKIFIHKGEQSLVLRTTAE